MPVFTPRGLKIRVDVPFAFGLMARLHPEITPQTVLKATEGIDLLDSAVPLLACMIGLALNFSALQIGLMAFVGFILARALKPTIFRSLPGLLKACTLFAPFYGWGVPSLIFVAFALYMSSWQSVVGYYIGLFSGGAVLLQYAMLRRGIDPPFGPSEWSFVYAYQYYASQIGANVQLGLSEAELSNGNWLTSFEDFSRDCPKAASMTLDRADR